MDLANISVLLDILIKLTGQAAQIGTLISQAHAEGRDVTKEELDTLFTADDDARKALEAAINAAAAKSSGTA